MNALNPVIDTGMGYLLQKVEDKGENIGDELLPLPWTLIQGYLYSTNAKGWKKGHSFIVVDYHQPTDRVLILEADGNRSTTKGSFPAPENGPRIQGFGHIDQCLSNTNEKALGPGWWNNTELPTWQSLTKKYKYRIAVRLHVNGLELTCVEAPE